MDDDFELELQKTFFQEASINMEESEEVYLQFSENAPMDLLARSFRLAHNLKGSAKAVGFSSIAEVLHHLESLLLKLKKKEMEINNNIINVLLKTNDCLKEMIEHYKIDPKYNADNKDLISEILKITNVSAPDKIEKNLKEEKGQENLSAEVGFFTKEKDPTPEKEMTPEWDHVPELKVQKIKIKKDHSDEIIRIPLSKIEKLQNYIGEIVIVQSMFEEQIKDSSNQILKNNFRLLNKTTKEVQDIIMNLRLVSVKPVFNKLERTARDTSLLLNKQINISFLGENTEIDKFILDEISDPLMHMVRNAIDHGLEENDERKAKNKMKIGNIIVSANHESGNLILCVQDDGKGLNPKIIYESAVKKGVIQGDKELSDMECLELIFAPGFSTKAETTEISGRGVGMDVVKTNVEMLNGKIEIYSEIDKGTTFKIKIPLSVGIMDAFITEIANEKYIIPVNQVVECLSLNKSNVTNLTGMDGVIILREEEIPIIDLTLGLQLKSFEKNKYNENEKVIIITKSNNKKIGVTIDKIIAIQSVVTKSIGSELRCEKGIVGSVILGDGKVVPILEISELVTSAAFQQNLQRNKSRVKV